MHVFYNRVSYGAKQLIDTFVGGSTKAKTFQELYDLIEQIAINSYTWGSIRVKVKPARVHSIDVVTAIESVVSYD